MGFRWLKAVLLGAPFLLAACGDEYEYVYEYIEPPCRSLVEIEDGNLAPESRTVKLTVPRGTQGGYRSTSGPAAFHLGEVAGNCVPSYDISLAVPPGTYGLHAILGHTYGQGKQWTIDSVEFLPNTSYKLSYLYGLEVDDQAKKFKDSTYIHYPLILRMYELPGEGNTLELAIFGPWQWVPGLTRSQIGEAVKLIKAGTDKQLFLSQRDKWLAENAAILATASS